MSRARWAAVAIGVVAVFFAIQGGEYSTLDLRELRHREHPESLQVAALERAVDSLARVAESIECDPLVQERVARERYGVIRDGELVYQLVPDSAPRR